ncbi:MAG: hypothetical protein HC872_08885 [Gammaproteobacteria bacterium]|nr:hypothetical protein [Gammaproteobacteria bacterium]
MQLRYRYEIGPLSDLYFVYGRGGFSLMRDEEQGVGNLFGSMFDVRDADQLLVEDSLPHVAVEVKADLQPLHALPAAVPESSAGRIRINNPRVSNAQAAPRVSFL